MRFGFTSIQQASANAKVALRRFPLVLLCGVLAASVAMMLVASGDENWTQIRILLAATLGFPLLVAFETTAERKGWTGGRRYGLQAAGVAILLLFHLLSRNWTATMLITRYVQLNLAFHLLVAFLPFAGIPAKHAFWQYNRILFLRFLLAALYTAVLFIGLAVALLALDNLFGIHIDGEAYAHLWIGLAFIFHPWFFLGSMPPDLAALEQHTDYPPGLKVFAQFVLIPVVTIYVLILSAYLVRVLVTRTWPSGWIGWLVSSVAAAGTLALLLVHPARERDDSRWVDAYGRWFYVALLPSIAMLLMAIAQRLGQYGFTERRYFLLVLALWLGAIALYYGVTGSRNIRLIPVTLCIVALATLAGPWSAYGVSRRSQMTRFENLLTANGLLRDGEIVTAAASDTPDEATREISAVLRYLVEAHGLRSLDEVSPELRLAVERADTVLVNDPFFRSNQEVARMVVENGLGLSYVNAWETVPADWVNYYTPPYGYAVDVEGYEVLVRVDLASTDTTRVSLGPDTLALAITKDPSTLWLQRAGGEPASIPLWPLVDEARTVSVNARPTRPGEPVPQPTAPLQVRGEAGGVRWLIVVPVLNGSGRGPAADLNSGQADVLLSYAGG